MSKLSVKFDSTPFRRSHDSEPKGRGSWAFALEERENDLFWSPSMTFTEAKKWATAHVRAMADLPEDLIHVWVLVQP